jgi:DNA-binding protein YbaB
MLPWENYDLIENRLGHDWTLRTRIEITRAGVRVTMNARKQTLKIKLDEELFQAGPEKIGACVIEALDLARAHADYTVGKAYHDGTELQELMDEFKKVSAKRTGPLNRRADLSWYPVPELSAALQVLIEETGLSLAEVAESSGLTEEMVDELMRGGVYPVAGICCSRTGMSLVGAMIYARPLARSFGLSAEDMVRRGKEWVAMVTRRELKQIQRKVLGLKSKRRRRSRPEGMALGRLKDMEIEPEVGLQVRLMCQGVDVDRPEREEGELGRLLGPDGEVLLPSITQDTFTRILKLDEIAKEDPEKIPAEELAWVRELLGWELPVVGTPQAGEVAEEEES